MVRYEALLDDVGHFGVAQFCIFIMLSYYPAFAAFHALATVFIGYVPEFRCDFGDDAERLFGNHSEDELVRRTTPYDETKGEYSTCYHYPYEESRCNGSFSCFNTTQEPVQCGHLGYRYDKTLFTETAVSEFDMVCDDYYLNAVATSMYQIGNFVGSIAFGNFADKYGRKTTCILTFFLALSCSFALSYSSSIAMYITFRGLTAAFAYGTAIGTYVYVTEIVGAKHRALVGVGYHMFYPLGYMLQSLLAYFYRDWHQLMFICTLVSTPLLLFCFIVPESPRWLLSTGRTERGKKIVELMARINKKQLSEEAWKKATDADIDEETKSTKTYTTLDLFRYPNIRKMTLCIMLQWFIINMLFYGISLNAGSLAGDIFVNNTISGVMEMLAYVMSIGLIEKLGRRATICGGMLLTSVALLTSCLVIHYAAGNRGMMAFSVVLAMLGKIGSSICSGTIYTATVELFPTVLRSNGLGIGSASSRIGGTLAAFVIALQKYIRWLPNVILGALGLVAAVAAVYLPEMKGQMMDNIQETEEFLSRKKNKKEPTSLDEESGCSA